jgi:protein NirF
MKAALALWLLAAALPAAGAAECMPRGTGDLGLVVERASGSVQIVDTTARRGLFRVTGLGDLSHASAVFSRDARHAYVFGRDGGLNQVDLLCGRLVRRVVQAGNSIGGAISQDGRFIAAANYEPGGVRVFDAATLEQLADIPATDAGGARSKVVGLEDAPGNRFLFSLFEAGESRMIEMSADGARVSSLGHPGRQPYDALITPDGRYYIVGLFGEDGLAQFDLWHPEQGLRRILDGYGRGEEPLPVYKMPHLESWAAADGRVFLPAIGRHEVLAVSSTDWRESGRIAVHGQPVFVQARPDGRQLWVNFAHPHNGVVQVIDTESLQVTHTLEPGPGVMHLEFSPRGEAVWISVRDRDEVQVYDTASLARLATLTAVKPSGIFFSARAHRIGL